ncbi:glycosyltransferase family 4 protein [Actinoplanes auranticolor]|nr:glycosyltransferase family 4 protein [Actinoplanes auranticolor]
MRILHVINNGSTCGGAERLTADLVRAQRAGGHDVHVLAGDRPGPGEWFADSTWPVRTARGPARIRNFYVNQGARAALRELLSRFAPDVVHLHTIGLLSAGALPLLRGTPTVMTVHGPEYFVGGTVRYCLPAAYFRRADRVAGRLNARGVAAYAWGGVVTAGLSRYLLRRHVDVFTAPSASMAGLVERSLGPTRIIRNGLDEGFRAAVRARTANPPGTGPRPLTAGAPGSRARPVTDDAPASGPRLVTAGRLEDVKGVQVLLAAMPAILAAYPEARLTVLGTGSMEDRLRRLAGELGVGPAVSWAGWSPPATMAAALAAADIAVVPSIWPESFGLTALEALAAGCAVVAADSGGLPDLVRPGETGLLVPPGDAPALAEAVLLLLADPALRARLAAAGTQLADQLTLTAYAEAVYAAYHDAGAADRTTSPTTVPGR